MEKKINIVTQGETNSAHKPGPQKRKKKRM